MYWLKEKRLFIVKRCVVRQIYEHIVMFVKRYEE